MFRLIRIFPSVYSCSSARQLSRQACGAACGGGPAAFTAAGSSCSSSSHRIHATSRRHRGQCSSTVTGRYSADRRSFRTDSRAESSVRARPRWVYQTLVTTCTRSAPAVPAAVAVRCPVFEVAIDDDRALRAAGLGVGLGPRLRRNGACKARASASASASARVRLGARAGASVLVQRALRRQASAVTGQLLVAHGRARTNARTTPGPTLSFTMGGLRRYRLVRARTRTCACAHTYTHTPDQPYLSLWVALDGIG